MLGDLKERASLDPACRGVDVVVTTANSALRGGADNPQTVDVEGNRNLIDVAKAAGVRQFVFVSAMAADSGSPVPFVAAKGKTEEYLVGSGMTYTILAPNAFMDFWNLRVHRFASAATETGDDRGRGPPQAFGSSQPPTWRSLLLRPSAIGMR